VRKRIDRVAKWIPLPLVFAGGLVENVFLAIHCENTILEHTLPKIMLSVDER
jgi:hypothetical protein